MIHFFNRVGRLLLVSVMMSASLSVAASDDHQAAPLQKAKTNVLDTASLQRGADIYAQYCMGCHSLKYLRISRAARDLEWTPEEGVSHFQYLRNGKGKPNESILTTLDPKSAIQAFGVLPPDLSLEARLKGKDWLFTFLKSYQRQENGTVNNTLFPGVAMPFVLEGMQKERSPADFDLAVADLVNFLDYAAEPAKPVRLMLGWWVLGFLALLFTLTYLLKKEYWLDVNKA